MANEKLLLTINYKLDAAQNFVSSIQDEQYYFFVSNHIDANNAVRPYDNQQDTLISSYQGMVFGKRIRSNDASIAIKRITWSANTIYDIYDHRDQQMYDKNFYVIVHEGTQWDVFKCLENGGGNPSVVAPSRTNVGSSGEDFYFPTDGYRWKYLYSVSDADEVKFGTSLYFPVHTDETTQAQAKPGSIDAVIVESPGRGYGNYFYGALGVGDVRLNGDPRKYGISTPGVNLSNGYYEGCWLYISSGPGAGQYRTIQSYTSNSTYNFVVLDSEFDPSNTPENGSLFEITPAVSIVGDGLETAPAYARAIINPAGNTVARVEMIERGQRYFHGTATVDASPVVGVTATAVVTPMMSPYHGHGSNAEVELGGKYVCVAVDLVGSEGSTVITNNDYSQIGIIKNPLFNNVEITLKNANKDFFTNEIVYNITPRQLMGGVGTILDSNNSLTDVLLVSGVDATSIVDVGETILINWSSNYQLANVVAVTSTSIKMDAPALWNTGSGTANIHAVTVRGQGVIDGFATGSVILTDATSTFRSNDYLIGAETGVFAQANVVTINSATKTFGTYVGAYTYVGTLDQGTFTPDEVVYQIGNPSANARFHSYTPDANTGGYRFYTTNQYEVFNTAGGGPLGSNQIKGEVSGAIATLTNKYLPDLVYGSGDVIYIEYGDSITRTDENTESFKLVFTF
jgi:hypothetical protein